MGFFSWLTCDTGESIANVHSGRPTRTVYLLQPGGLPPIREDAYDGYGEFGGVDAHVWLARANRHMIRRPQAEVDALDDEALRAIGIALDCGNYYVDSEDGSRHSVFHASARLIDPSIRHHGVTYDVPIAHFGGRTANELVAEGRLVATRFDCDVALKFSHDPNAVHEDLPPSASCPDQGFFYGDGDDDEEDVEEEDVDVDEDEQVE